MKIKVVKIWIVNKNCANSAQFLYCCAPDMGNNLVVKVHYRLGSRNC